MATLCKTTSDIHMRIIAPSPTYRWWVPRIHFDPLFVVAHKHHLWVSKWSTVQLVIVSVVVQYTCCVLLKNETEIISNSLIVNQ